MNNYLRADVAASLIAGTTYERAIYFALEMNLPNLELDCEVVELEYALTLAGSDSVAICSTKCKGCSLPFVI